MHELGVVFYVVRDVKEVALENDVKRVNSVTLQLGEVSGVVPHLLEDCWNWARKKETVMQDAKLIIEQIDAVTYCQDCGSQYATVQYAKKCPHCGSENTYLLQGTEFLIKEIEAV